MKNLDRQPAEDNHVYLARTTNRNPRRYPTRFTILTSPLWNHGRYKEETEDPTPYSGKREDLRKFLQEVKIYLLANEDSYPENLDKILFVLSYMSEGDANSWKEEYIDSIEQKQPKTTQL